MSVWSTTQARFAERTQKVEIDMDTTGRKIWKFSLVVKSCQGVLMPESAKVISAHNQEGVICLWAICHPDEPHRIRRFSIVGTDHPMPTDLAEFIGTVLVPPLVWHVFELLDAGTDAG